MDMNYDILSYDELPADEAAMLKADAEEAERGYTDEQLSEALKRTPGRPLAVGSTPASNVIRVRLDDERDAKLERYMRKHHMSRSNAVRTLLDKALAEISILRPKAGPPSRGGGPAVFPTYVIRPMSVFLGVPRTKWQPLVDGRDGRSRTRRARRRTRPYAGTRTS